MAITPLPTPPSRNDPTNFATRGDAFLGALPAFATEANALAVDVNADAAASSISASTASAAAIAATAAAGVVAWVSGTTYTAGTVVYSPITYLAYRRKTGGAGTTDPSLDTTNWALSGGTGNVFAENPGSSGQVLRSLGPGVNPAFQDAPGATITEFSSSGTWTKPAGANFVQVEVWGAGGGGASGDRRALATARLGGAAGGGGGYNSKIFKASELQSSVLVTIGAGGNGGAAVTTDSTAGLIGAAGGDTSFGTTLIGYAGNPGRDTGIGGGGGGTQSRGSFGTNNGGAPRFTATGTLVQAFGGGDGAISGTGGNAQPSGFGGAGGGGFNGAALLVPASSSWGGAGGGPGAAIQGSELVTINTTFVPGYFGGSSVGGLAYTAQTDVTGNGMAFGNGRFVQRAITGFISVSTNGTTWTIAPAVAGVALSYFLYDGTQWVASNGQFIFTSTDLVTWKFITEFSHNRMAFANGLYVAVGSGGSIRTSINLYSWTSQTSGTAVALSDVIYDGTRWIVVGASGVSLTSTNAITWTVVTTASSGSWVRVASSGSVIVATSSLTPFAWRSTNNGVSWSPVATTLLSSGNIAFANSLFVLTSSTSLWSSTDGNTWTSRTNPTTTDSLNGIAFGLSTWAIGSASTNTNAAITSADATTWTTRTATSLAAGAQAGGVGNFAGGGAGGAASTNGTNSGAGGAGGSGYCRVYAW